MCGSFHISYALHSKEQVGRIKPFFQLFFRRGFCWDQKTSREVGGVLKTVPIPSIQEEFEHRVGTEASREGMYLREKGPE